MRKNVSNIIASTTLSFLRQHGVDTQAIQTRCQLSQYELDKSGGRIAGRQHLRFIRETAAYDFLWREHMLLGEASDRIIDHAYALFPELVGYCLNQPTAHDAVQSYIRNRIIIGNCDGFHLESKNDTLSITYLDETGLPHSAIGNFILLRELVRLYAPKARPEVVLSGDAGAAHSSLDDLFGCHCQFEPRTNIIRFSGASLMIRTDRHLPQLYKQQHQQLALKVKTLECEQGLASLVEALLVEALANEKIDDESSCLDHLCSVMGMSRWTLNARLQQEEQTFSKILQRVRIEQACFLLSETQLGMQEIGERLHFSSLSVFSRFFSTHMGISPRHYRQRSRPAEPNSTSSGWKGAKQGT